MAIVRRMMELPFCHPQGPEHHVMVGLPCSRPTGTPAAVLSWNPLFERCTAGAGLFPAEHAALGCLWRRDQRRAVSVHCHSVHSLAREPWGLSNRMTACALESIEKRRAPMLQRDSFLSILAAVDFVRGIWGVEMERTVPVCSYSSRNHQCIGRRCPFSAAGHAKPKVAFLCVHNSCRSQMAEALGKNLPAMYSKAFPPAPSPARESIRTRCV